MKPCPSFPGYSATEDGRIISHRRRGCGMQRGSVTTIDPSHAYQLSQHTTRKGYRTVCIVLPNGKSRPVGVHQLVADAFHGPRPCGLQVRHLNGTPSDNTPNNLRYGTQRENGQDRMDHGSYLSGGSHQNAKLSSAQAESVRQRRGGGEKVATLAREFGVSISTVEGVIYGKTYRAGNVEFKRVLE